MYTVDVESVNQHFLAIAHKTINDLPLSSTSALSYIPDLDVPDIRMAKVDISEVHRYICDLNINKAVGMDNISFLLKAFTVQYGSTLY